MVQRETHRISDDNGLQLPGKNGTAAAPLKPWIQVSNLWCPKPFVFPLKMITFWMPLSRLWESSCFSELYCHDGTRAQSGGMCSLRAKGVGEILDKIGLITNMTFHLVVKGGKTRLLMEILVGKSSTWMYDVLVDLWNVHPLHMTLSTSWPLQTASPGWHFWNETETRGCPFLT